ncbi:AAA family ATPase [Caballeronia sp. 15715]|uniref:AAA family ATPase n=1 Tax=unclassified Caballeronia TaxID=2646786 RepID=UPI0039E5215B
MKTIHRLLEVNPANGCFKRSEESPLECDVLASDECSTVDLPLANQLLRGGGKHHRGDLRWGRGSLAVR